MGRNRGFLIPMNTTKRKETEAQRTARLEYMKKYREANKAALKEKAQERYQENKDAVMEYRRNWRRAKTGDPHHDALVLKSRRKFRETHAEQILEDDRRYREEFPEFRAAARHGSRARKIGTSNAEQIAAAEEWIKEAKSAESGTCPYCQKVFPMAALGIDHIIPYSKGGVHSPENLTLCCNPCNSSKGAKLIEEHSENSAGIACASK